MADQLHGLSSSIPPLMWQRMQRLFAQYNSNKYAARSRPQWMRAVRLSKAPQRILLFFSLRYFFMLWGEKATEVKLSAFLKQK